MAQYYIGYIGYLIGYPTTTLGTSTGTLPPPPHHIGYLKVPYHHNGYLIGFPTTTHHHIRNIKEYLTTTP